jgi:hypothetical protein
MVEGTLFGTPPAVPPAVAGLGQLVAMVSKIVRRYVAPVFSIFLLLCR